MEDELIMKVTLPPEHTAVTHCWVDPLKLLIMKVTALGEIRKGGYAMIRGMPCKLFEVEQVNHWLLAPCKHSAH